MKKIYAVILVIILLLAGGIIYYNFYSYEYITVKDIEFRLPHGYKEDGLNNQSDLIISNGTDKLYFTYINGSDVNKYIKNFDKYMNSQNKSIVVSDYKINNMTIYQTTSDSGNYNFWFVYNNNTYRIYNWNKNPYVINTVNELISNAKLS